MHRPIRSVSIAFLAAAQLWASDWTGPLGNDNSGIVADANIRTNWIESAPKTIWTASVGIGCAGFAISDGKAITLGYTGKKDTITCLDIETGKAIWIHEYPQKLGNKYYTGGPSATPRIDGERVYILSKFGELHCMNLNTGKLIWKKQYKDDLDGKAGQWGWAMPPYVEGDLLITDPGSDNGAVVALNKMTGETVWSAGDFKPGYASPEMFEFNGKRSMAIFHAKYLVGYDLENPGEILFSYLWRTNYGVNASKPHFFDGQLFLASGYGEGYAVIDIKGEEPKQIHRSRDLKLQFQNSLYSDKRVTAVFDGGELARINVASGDVLWTKKVPGERGNILQLGDYHLLSTDSGHLIVGTVDDSGFQEIGRTKVLDETTWAYPAYSDGKLLLRDNKGNAVSVDISK